MTTNSDVKALPRAGVIGLGAIGGGVAVSLAHSGFSPVIFDIRPDAAAKLTPAPTQLASPAEVARQSDVVLIAVVNAAQAEEVLSGPGGILAGAHANTIVALLSTVSIQAVEHLAVVCAAASVPLLDAGVTGGGKAAQNGLVTMVGGSDDVIARAMPVLRGFSKAVIPCGGQGAGMTAKLARNLITYGQWAVVHEAASLAQAGNVSPERLLNVMREGDDEGSDHLSLLRGLAAGYRIPTEQAVPADKLAQKDLAAAQEFAASAGLETPLADRIRSGMYHVFAGDLSAPLPEEPHARGLAMMDRTYGAGFSRQMPPAPSIPSIDFTVEQLFAKVWSRPWLTLRDRRLFTLGITAMLGRPELIETQLRGAIANGELTVEQLRELVLHGSYYAGWGNGMVLQGVVEKLIAENPGKH